MHLKHGGPLQKARAQEIVGSHADSVRRARDAGVRIACGSDGGVYGHDFTFELELLASAGLSPAETIVATTSGAAECLGWQDEIGVVKPGLKADLLVVSGNPLEDIGVLRDRRNITVIKAGNFLSAA
jgi:imidazolonepropionase-like amidohydrolase